MEGSISTRYKVVIKGSYQQQSKRIFKKKVEEEDSIKYNERCVWRSILQIPGEDFILLFAWVGRDMTISRVIVGAYVYYNKLNTKDQWVLEMFDVEAASLYVDLLQPSYIEWQLQGV